MTFSSFSDIDKKLANREPVFIRNKSRHKTSNALSILILNYPSAEGEKSFNIPRSTTPFNICDHVDPESLRSSSSFRKYLNTGSIEVVDEDVARRESDDPAIQDAFRASYNEANNTYVARSGEQRATVEAEAAIKAEKARDQSAGMKNIIAAMDPKLAQALNIRGADGQQPDPKLLSTRSPRFTALESRVRAKSLGDAQVVSELSLMLSDLSLDDLATVAAGGIWPNISVAWAKERLEFKARTA
jgi:hypothetical protein